MLNLTGLYTKEVWERGGKIKEHKKYIGLPYISWSQIETFNDKVGFNTGLLGEFEYIINRFSKEEFREMGWGVFGSELEAYITLRNQKDLSKVEEKVQKEFQDALINFTDREKAILDTIEPLGVFQDEICYFVKELNIIVLGYIDDRTKEDKEGNIKLLRDYKSKSESSKKDLHLDKKYQIELYILGLRQRGLNVLNAEYCIVERLGGYQCMQGGGRESLSVGDRIWYEPYSWTEDRLEQTHNMVVDTAKRISSLKNTYDLYFGKKE
jgi:hypothetical protein